MSKKLKKRMADEFTENVKNLDSFILFSFHKMNALQAYSLRKQLREQNVGMKIVKNKIAARTFSERYQNTLEDILQGPMAMAYGGESPADVAKALLDWNKKQKVIDIKGGFLSNRPLGKKEAEQLAKIPPKPVLLSMIAGSFKSPMNKVATSLKAPLQDLAYAVHGLAEKKEEN